MKQITIYDLLPLLQKGWLAMDENKRWYWYKMKPIFRKTFGVWKTEYAELLDYVTPLNCFNIAPFEGDWRDSLIKVKHKEE